MIGCSGPGRAISKKFLCLVVSWQASSRTRYLKVTHPIADFFDADLLRADLEKGGVEQAARAQLKQGVTRAEGFITGSETAAELCRQPGPGTCC